MLGTIAYAAHAFDYEAQFADRSTMAITVFPTGKIRVIAPKATTQEEIELRLRKRARWLIRQLLHFEQFRPRAPERRYVGGETHLYLGRQYRLKLHKRAYPAVKLQGAYIHVHVSDPCDAHAVRDLVTAWYRSKGKARLTERFALIAPIFARLGCQPGTPTIRSMPHRWGSWSRGGRIALNPDLIRAPMICIDYVIIHELTHLLHPHHGSAFYDLLDDLLPDWKKRKHRLEQLLS